MRHYETNSKPAVARLLAATVLADGGLGQALQKWGLSPMAVQARTRGLN